MTWRHDPVVSADRRRWQREAATTLIRLLVFGAEAQAEPLIWTVNDGLLLTGRVPGRYGPAARHEMSEIFSVWLDLLGGDSPHRRESADGALTLRAECRWERVIVVLSAHVLDVLDEGEDL
jgi:hypothetical protein